MNDSSAVGCSFLISFIGTSWERDPFISKETTNQTRELPVGNATQVIV